MKNLLLILTLLLVSCGSDSDSVSPFGPETLIGDWELQKLEYNSYFAAAVMPGDESRVVVLNEPVVYEAPNLSGTASFSGEALLMSIKLAHIELMSGSYQYIADNGVIDLGPFVREEMLVSIPINPRCSDDCLGLCPICGGDLNEIRCQHDEIDIDPRLEVLRSYLGEDLDPPLDR